MVETFFGRMRPAYFAVKGTSTGWEIGRLAYLSRTGGDVKGSFGRSEH